MPLVLGLKRNWRPKFNCIFALGFFALSAKAYVPTPGQMIRLQPNLLKNEKPFQSKGAATTKSGRAEYTLQWWGPQQYQVLLTNVPRGLSGDNSPSTWTLIRQGTNCVLRAGGQVVQCPRAALWANLEFSARGDLIAKSLQDAGIYDATDAGYSETHSKDYRVETKNRRAHLVLAQNGTKPVAAIEVRSQAATENPKLEDYPVFQVDQSFLAPILARFSFDGELLSVKATSDFEVRRGRSRYTYVLAEKVDVFNGKNLLANFSRGEMKPLGTLTQPTPPKAITDISALKNNLSTEGREFLTALLATH